MRRKTASIIGRIVGLILVATLAFGVAWCATHWSTVKAETSKWWDKITGVEQKDDPPTPDDPTPVDPTPDDPTPDYPPTPEDPTPEDPTPDDPTPEDPTPETPHEHLWSEWVSTLAPTCTTDGTQTRTCECGETETQTIPFLGHIEGGWETRTVATCTTDGLKVKKCSRCGGTLDTEVIPALGHDYDVELCLNCGDVNFGALYGAYCFNAFDGYYYLDVFFDSSESSICLTDTVVIDGVYYYDADLLFESYYELEAPVEYDDRIEFCVNSDVTLVYNKSTRKLYLQFDELYELQRIENSGLEFECIDYPAVKLEGDNLTLAGAMMDGFEYYARLENFETGICEHFQIIDSKLNLLDYVEDLHCLISSNHPEYSEATVTFDVKVILEKNDHSFECRHFGESWTMEYVHDYVDGICSICGFSCEHEHVNGHICPKCGSSVPKILTWRIETPATCTESGVEWGDCICGYNSEMREIAPLGHDYVDGVCSRCGEPDPDYVDETQMSLAMCLTEDTGLDVNFQNLEGMTSVDWGDGVINSELTHTYSDYGEYSVKIADVTSIGINAFGFLYGLTSVSISNNVTTIESYAFCECTGLISITISSSVTRILSSAFMHCGGLESIIVDINNTEYKSEGNCLLTKDGKTLILGCKNSSIPDGVTTIYGYAFGGCAGLISIAIPNSVTKIMNYAFENCTELIEIDFSNCEAIPSLIRHAFSNINEEFKIIVPDALYDEWIEAEYWSDYADHIVKASDYSVA